MVRLEDRGRAGDLVARLGVGVRRQPRRLARLVVVREHDRRPAPRRRTAPRASGWRRRSPRRPSAVRISSKSKTRWRGALSLGASAGSPENSSPTVIRSGNESTRARNSVEEAGQLGPVLVVEVDLAVVRAPAAEAARVGEQLLVLEERVEDVEPEAVDPALEPAADHRQHRLAHGRVAPVHVGLLGQERVHVELAADLVPGPRRPAEERRPVVRLARRARTGRSRRRATDTSRRTGRPGRAATPRTSDGPSWCGSSPGRA